MSTPAAIINIDAVDAHKPDRLWRRLVSNPRIIIGGGMVFLIVATSLITMIWTLKDGHNLYYDKQQSSLTDRPPAWAFAQVTRVSVPRSGTQQRRLGNDLTAVRSTSTAIELAWIDRYRGQSGFRLERALAVGDQRGQYTELGTFPAGVTTFKDETVVAGTVYLYRLWPTDVREVAAVFGTDRLGRSLLARCLLGGSISIMVGLAAATIAVLLGVSIGLVAGFRGGWTDAFLMRLVDIMYGLPYILLVILFKVAFEPHVERFFGGNTRIANIVTLFVAIGLVSWLTMARVVRGQVLSLRSQAFIEAARAVGLPEWRIFLRHLLPNLVGPITVYATLTVPQAILQESFLSFLGIGISAPMPSWGNLASDGLQGALNPFESYWWQLVFPCTLLTVTLLSLNYFGDGLRDIFDPKRESAKI
jgi:ABC-type dipeptide/oligopeptide/nickel transport system permease subunit